MPQDQNTIQAAIDIAQDGDVITVFAGTYLENINFSGKAITVKSKEGPSVTTIDGDANDSVVTFVSGETSASILNGFTLRNGLSGFDTPGFGDGGGIRIENSSPTIRNNIIENNQACDGLGISVGFGSPLIEANVIVNNTRTGCSGGIGGGGIALRGAATARILNNTISGNVIDSSGGGIAMFAAGTPIIRGNFIQGNTASEGGGIDMVNQSDALIVQNLIVGNSAGTGGGVYWLVPFDDRGPFLVNNTIARNSSANGSGVFADGFDARSLLVNNIIAASAGEVALFCGDFNDTSSPRIRFNDVFSASGAAYGGTCADKTGVMGNISANPLFVSSRNGDFHLRKLSPAVDAGDNGAPKMSMVDFDRSPRIQDGNLDSVAIVDMGVDEFTPSAAASGEREGAIPADQSLHNDLKGMPSLLFSHGRLSDAMYQKSSDNQITVSAYDSAGNLINRIDANGIKKYAP